MNILYLTNHLDTGGITSYVYTLAGGLKERGHRVYLASAAGERLQRFLELGLDYIPVPLRTKSEISPKILFSVLKLKSIIREKKIDIIHANSRTTQVLAHFLSKICGIPYVATCHGFFKRRFSRLFFPCWGKKVIAISEPVKGHLINDFGLPPDDIVLIHSGIDSGAFAVCASQQERQKARQAYGLKDACVIGIIARLSEEKGHIYLIEAMQIVLRSFADARLLIVGQGRTRQALIEKAAALGLKEKVFFVPEINEMGRALSLIDIFVLPSLKEGLGLSLMEAMAYGLPVIGTRVGGIKSLIQDNLNGLLVNPADSQDLARAVIDLLRQPQKRQSLGNRAAAFIRENFSKEKMVLATEEVYAKSI
jgi:glycosyltransferase involved in cell wall biosynthesis